MNGDYGIMHVDEMVDQLLNDETCFSIGMPQLQSRMTLEEMGIVPERVCDLVDDLVDEVPEKEPEKEEDPEPAAKRRREESPEATREPGDDRRGRDRDRDR